MSSYARKVVNYFRPPEKYFWLWAEAGQVIEWRDGDTICYRDELMDILKKLSPEGFPSFGSILLIISACREKAGSPAAQEDITYGMLRVLDYYEKNSAILKGLKEEMVSAIRFLQYVSALPPELRNGPNRTWLLYIIFSRLNEKIPENEATGIIDHFNSGKFDQHIFKDVIPGRSAACFEEDMKWLNKALRVFPTAHELETAVRTGLKELPGAANLEVPQPAQETLLEQLAKDPKTTGLAQLTSRLIAALNIPMHAHGSSDQLFGGVSDITNRGNFDRLLLSELAHDDLSLMARLANNEALYLRREELPSNPEKQRILLIDTTIKMWGLPRVFAVSAALACAHNNKTKARVLSFALAGNSYTEINLASKEGVLQSLEQLDAALHPGRGLTLLMDSPMVQDEDEVFLITEEENSHYGLFQSMLASLKRPVNFLVTVNRSGQLQFYEFINGRRKLLSEARFDLQELLFPPKPVVKKQPEPEKSKVLPHAPAIMHRSPWPLCFPASKIRFDAQYFTEIKKGQVVCVTSDQRVLYWNDNKKGAREIIEFVEPGSYCFGVDETFIYLLVYGGTSKFVRLYTVNPELNTVVITKLPETLRYITEMVFDDGHFYVKAAGNISYSILAATGEVFPGKEMGSNFNHALLLKKSESTHLNILKRHINDGYTTINTIKSFYLNEDGELGFDDKHISFRIQGDMALINHNRQEPKKRIRTIEASWAELPSMGIINQRLRFTRFLFKDGSEVVTDSRGFLHLRSSDKDIPEITIVTIMHKPTACWAADGAICGPDYFRGASTTKPIAVMQFYMRYMIPFIKKLA